MVETIADVFIIESLDPDDEGNGRFEGSFISSLLRLHGKRPEYRYVRTKKEFKKAVRAFGRSRFRYLHISAHGNKDGLCTTNLEDIDYDELAKVLKPHMEGRRLFLSTCSMVHEDMAAYLVPTSKCLSVIGPEGDVDFHRAAIFWTSLYHLMFLKDTKRFTAAGLRATLAKTSDLFEVKVRYFFKSANKRGYGESLIGKG